MDLVCRKYVLLIPQIHPPPPHSSSLFPSVQVSPCGDIHRREAEQCPPARRKERTHPALSPSPHDAENSHRRRTTTAPAPPLPCHQTEAAASATEEARHLSDYTKRQRITTTSTDCNTPTTAAPFLVEYRRTRACHHHPFPPHHQQQQHHCCCWLLLLLLSVSMSMSSPRQKQQQQHSVIIYQLGWNNCLLRLTFAFIVQGKDFPSGQFFGIP
uniref:Uncharacterized protein n=1 Tax=Globodera pallida TaxID=36090 RepID=A0A183CK83_GLOPA